MTGWGNVHVMYCSPLLHKSDGDAGAGQWYEGYGESLSR